MKRIKVSNLFLIILLISLFSYQDFYAQYKIGFSQCSTEHEWRKSQIRDMQIESAFFPDMKLIIKDAENRSDIQIKQIEDFIKEGVNLLIISANESEALTPVIKKAFRSGIPIILLERLINSDSYTAYIGSNNYNTGREAARYANKLLGGQGDIIEITGWFKTSSAIERQRGFNDEISNYPKINIIKSIDGEWNYDKSEREISNILKSGLSFDLVYAHNDMMALGALKAIKNRGIESRPYILGIDGLTGELGGMQAVLNKDIDATFLYPTGGALAIKTANDILRKQPFKRQNILETLVIDSTNVKILKLLNDQMESFQQNLEIQSSNLSFQIS
ncbi:MAG TPA: substrate-binding domain-containing protein [Flavobacterium sp.]